MIFLIAAALTGLSFLGLYHYLMFHVLVEMFSIVIGFTVFVLTWNARQILNNGYLLFLGIALLFVSALDLLHTLSYQGMNFFPAMEATGAANANLSTQLWLCARYLQSATLIAAPFFVKRVFRPRLILLTYSAITGLLLLSIFYWQNFPTAYADGLTPFKRVSEYIIIFFFLVGIGLLLSIRQAFSSEVHWLLLSAMAVNILAEFAFTEYRAVNDLINMTGHFLKIASFYLIYKAIIDTGFRKPQQLLYRELAQSEQALRELSVRERARASQVEAIMDAAPAVVWIALDPEARMVTGNRAASDILRMPANSNLSKTAPEGEVPTHFRVYQNGQELAPEELPLQVSAASGKPVRNFEEQILFDDGEQRSLFGNVSPLLDESGRPAGAVAAFIDITDRVAAERALQESEQRYRSLFESIEEGFLLQEILYDKQGNPDNYRILEVNPAFEKMTGMRREQMVGHTLREILPDAGREWLDHYASVARTGDAQHFEVHASALDRYFEILLYRLGPLQMATLTIDITASRKGQEALRRSEAEARAYASQLEQSNRELQDFAFVASHDLQEPLRKIQAFGERLKDHMGAHLDDEARDYLERMMSASLRMRNMVNDLLSLSRVTTQGQPFTTVDLNDVAREVLSDLELRIERSGGLVKVDSLPVIEADATQMNQLLQNLLANALKFHHPGQSPQVRLYSDYLPEIRQVKLFVEDNGIGFDEQYLERIFQPFQRLHGRSEFEGSGIGLAVCRKIVERHGGTITANSIPEQGSTFIVVLPEARPSRSESLK